jgi:NAD-dependent DNA ligase
MASEKVARILRKKEAPFTEEQISALSEHDAWTWIYAHDKQAREVKAKAKQPQVCFTGFTDSEKEKLKVIARQAGFEVKDSVTKGCAILVAGANAGWSKLEKAEAQGCIVVDEAGFMEYLRSKEKAEAR